MKEFKIDGYFEFTFNTQNPTTGAAADASATPTYRVYEDNNDTAVASGDCAKRDDANTLGYYYVRGQCTAALGYEVGKNYEVRCEATVATITGGQVVGTFRIVTETVDTRLTAVAGALPAVAAGAKGGLPITDAATGLILTGYGAGAVQANANLVAILGTALSETAGYLAASFKKFFNIQTATGTVNSLPDAVAGAKGGLPILDASTGLIITGYGPAAATISPTAGSIANASFNADVGSTVYASNVIALAVRKVLDELNLDHLLAVVTGAADMTTEVIDNSILARILGNGDTSTFVPSTDGLHAAGVDIDAILLDTGTTLDGRIPAALTAGGMLKVSLEEIKAVTVGGTAAQIVAAFVKFFDVVTPLLDCSAAMRGTDSAALASAWTATRAGYLTGSVALEATSQTLISRLGAWTGTGINTVLGAIRAMCGKTAGSLTPSDITDVMTTFTHTTDSQEAIKDAVSTPPTAADIADAVFDEAKGAHTGLLAGLTFTTPGKVDATATATLTDEDIADIAAGVIAGLGSATITVTSPTTASGDIELTQGADYASGTTRLVWTWTGSSLDVSTDVATFRTAGFPTGKTVTVTNGETTTKTLTLTLTRAEVFTIPRGQQEYEITFMTAGGLRRPESIRGNADVGAFVGISS